MALQRVAVGLSVAIADTVGCGTPHLKMPDGMRQLLQKCDANLHAGAVLLDRNRSPADFLLLAKSGWRVRVCFSQSEDDRSSESPEQPEGTRGTHLHHGIGHDQRQGVVVLRGQRAVVAAGQPQQRRARRPPHRPPLLRSLRPGGSAAAGAPRAVQATTSSDAAAAHAIRPLCVIHEVMQGAAETGGVGQGRLVRGSRQGQQLQQARITTSNRNLVQSVLRCPGGKRRSHSHEGL